jgi:predicted alpha-1,2-mannosidase
MFKALYFKQIVLVLLLTASCKIGEKTLHKTVNPFIGTGGHGHTFPGAIVPFGMVQLSPDTRLEGWDGCSGYHFSDSIIYGFSHTHLSGTGVSDYADLLLMPGSGKGSFSNKEYASSFNHKDEKAHAGYYAVKLQKHNIAAELSCTERSAIHRYKFSNLTAEPYIVIDLEHRDELLDVELEKKGANKLEGKRISKAWAQKQHFYFSLEFSSDIKKIEYKKWDKDSKKQSKAIVYFEKGSKEIIVRCGISFVDNKGAENNLKTEIKDWNFDAIKKRAEQSWDKALSKIQVEGGSKDEQVIFYSALYHTMTAPNLFTDADGRYRGMDDKIHQSKKGNIYSIFSLWDTFRATHPLYTLIERKRTLDFINTFLAHYKEGGRLPVWELAANETDCMIGYHSVSVIADAYAKGIREFDTNLALEAMLHSANRDNGGLKAYREKGLIAMTDNPESVSKTLEYAYDDWCISEMARLLGKDSIYREFAARAQHYKNVFDPKSAFMRARINGGLFNPFSPAEVNFNYTEANAWQYSLFVPQDIEGLCQMMGGKKGLENYLDSLFTTSSDLGGHEQADITGLIGQYAHGNEPSHHKAYLYNFVGKPAKTQLRLRQIMRELYRNAPDGLSGNEDCGQMSAWYVLSAMGFYAVTPGSDQYIIGSPIFNKITINYENGKNFVLEAKDNSSKNIFVKGLKLNGKIYTKSYISHKDLSEGKLEFEMSSDANTNWASETENSPKTQIADSLKIVPVPYFISASNAFGDSMDVSLSIAGNYDIYYWTGDQNDEAKAVLYQQPITIKDKSTFYAFAKDKNNKKSKTTKAFYPKTDKNINIRLNATFADRYAAGGQNALIDGLFGGDDYRSGFWQGYQKQDLVFTVDLGKEKSINYLGLNCLQDQRSWIWFPKEVKFEISSDGINFIEAGVVKNNQADNTEISIQQRLGLNLEKTARYLKVSAKNYGKCPEWHQGAGGDAWIFADELIIE